MAIGNRKYYSAKRRFAAKHELEIEMEAFIARHGLLEAGQVVVVGVSGGADSVALAAALRLIGRYVLHIAHIHHGIRADADGDADFVAELAEKWQTPFHLERIDTPSLARAERIGIEEAARTGRYEALSAIAARAGADAVAVAHHAGDQVETVLHRIVRGTHLRGLAGMTPKRKLNENLVLIRPLLWAGREQIERFCRSEGLSWRTDHTNAEMDFTRNFIRHELLPLLRDRLNTRADDALLRLASAAGEAESVLSELAERLFERACRKRSDREIVLRTAPLKKAPALLAAMALRSALAAMDAPQQALGRERFDDLLAVLDGSVTAVDLPGQIRAERHSRDIHLFRQG